MIKYILLWFPMLFLAIANGIMREALIRPRTTLVRAHQLSTFSLICLFSLYFYILILIFPETTQGQALKAGFLWLALTLAFEFGFGRYRGRTWGELIGEYNIFAGKVWILIPIWVTFGLWILLKLIK